MMFYLGLICLVGGVFFLLVNFNIISKKTTAKKSKPIEAQKIDNLLVRVASVLLCISGLYLMWPENDTVKEIPIVPVEQTSSNAEMVKKIAVMNTRIWNDELKEIITKQCLDNGRKTAQEYPDLVKDYCTCATENISQAMSPTEYTEWMQKSYEEQAARIRPIVQTCVDIMTKLIELSQEAAPKVNDPNSPR